MVYLKLGQPSWNSFRRRPEVGLRRRKGSARMVGGPLILEAVFWRTSENTWLYFMDVPLYEGGSESAGRVQEKTTANMTS